MLSVMSGGAEHGGSKTARLRFRLIHNAPDSKTAPPKQAVVPVYCYGKGARNGQVCTVDRWKVLCGFGIF